MFFSKPRVRKLNDENTAIIITGEMVTRNDDVNQADNVQMKWLLMKDLV